MARIVSPSPAVLTEAAHALRAGQLVAFATETVYGLGGSAYDDTAVARIFAAKGRPSFNPLIAHVPSAEEAARDVIFDARAHALAAAFWPGPLTLVLPKAAGSAISHLVSAGLPTVAIRVPGHPVAQAFLRAAGVPVAAPSANRSGGISPTCAAHVAASLGDQVDMVLDGGPCHVGLESTVVDLSTPQAALLRPGGITRAQIEAIIGPVLTAQENPDAPKSPGQLLSHYAPGLPVRLNVRSPLPSEAWLGFGPDCDPAQTVASLSACGDLVEAAANLFALLYAFDDPSRFSGIAVAPIPDHDLGAAINDRLRRAAAPR